MTNHEPQELLVEMWDHQGIYAKAGYSTIKILNNATYDLELGDFIAGQGICEAGDGFSKYSGYPFSWKNSENSGDTCVADMETMGWYAHIP